MLEVQLSDDLNRLVSGLDVDWEASKSENLPFPIAYALTRLHQEDYPWDLVMAGVLNALLKYMAALGVSDYLQGDGEPDFDVNDAVKQLARPMSEGKWLDIIRKCAKYKGPRVITEFPEVWADLEEGRYWAKLSSPEFSAQTGRQGLLSNLITLRNRVYAHGGWALTSEEKTQVGDQVVPLIRAVVHVLQPLLSYEVAQTFTESRPPRTLVLRGVGSFKEIVSPPEAGDASCFLLNREGAFAMQLHPIAFASRPEKQHRPTMLDEESEMYVLNNLERRRIPVYLGLGGGQSRREDLSEPLSDALKEKRVWENRQDIELDSVVSFLGTKTAAQLVSLEENGLFEEATYVERPECEDLLRQFIADTESQALFLSGRSGGGKTATVLHLVDERVQRNEATMLIRALELPTGIVKPHAFERWLTAALGYTGKFKQILQRCQADGHGQFVLIVDGLNEFTAAGRDSSLLFRAINTFLAAHEEEHALKVIMTSREDMLNVFLPGRKLPLDVDESLYFRPHGQDYASIDPLSASEAREILNRSGIPTDRIDALLRRDASSLRNPRILRQIALGALGPEDLKDLDERGITSRFIDRRLGRDRQLRKTLLELVELMGKVRDQTVSEDVLAEKSPKLSARLQAEGGQMITTLRELGMVQVTEQVNEDGDPTWSIALAHDALFDALHARQQRSLLTSSVLTTLTIFGVIAIVVIFLARNMHNIFYASFDAEGIRNDISLKVERLDLPAASKVELHAACRALHKMHEAWVTTIITTFTTTAWRASTAIGVPIALLMLLDNIGCHVLRRRDGRAPRLIYYDLARQQRNLKRLHWVITPTAIAVVAWSIVRVIRVEDPRDQREIIQAMWPLVVLGAGMSFLLPWLSYARGRAIAAGTDLLKEARLSPESLKNDVCDSVKRQVFVTIVCIFLWVALDVRLSSFMPNNWQAQIRTDARSILSTVDMASLSRKGLDKVSPLSDALGQQNDGRPEELIGFLEQNLPGAISAEGPAFCAAVRLCLVAMVLLVFAVSTVDYFVFRWLARKYYTGIGGATPHDQEEAPS